MQICCHEVQRQLGESQSRSSRFQWKLKQKVSLLPGMNEFHRSVLASSLHLTLHMFNTVCNASYCDKKEWQNKLLVWLVCLAEVETTGQSPHRMYINVINTTQHQNYCFTREILGTLKEYCSGVLLFNSPSNPTGFFVDLLQHWVDRTGWHLSPIITCKTCAYRYSNGLVNRIMTY